MNTRAFGRFGEKLAEEYYVSLGAKILERNFHVRYAEVDIILEHEGDLVAVEVKTRSVLDMGAPEECVFPSQLRRIVRGLTTYAQDNEMLEMPFRIDVIAIVTTPEGDVLRFTHLPSVFPG
jgi:putative endonuclease